jgi:hypothetical protein
MNSNRALGLWACWTSSICLISSFAFSQNAFEQRWPTATDSLAWPLAYTKPAAQFADPFGALPLKPLSTGLPAESGVNYTLSPWGGYLNLGSGIGSQAVGGTSGSVAFPIGQSFGLLTQGATGSIGGNGIYDVGSILYWRAPALGLAGGTAQIGHFDSFGGANFASGGANFEDYLGRFTPFATVGAFGAQRVATKGYGTVGLAYYPTDNLQLALSGFDAGGFSGVQGSAEYLLPQRINGVATTVSADGFVANHGSSGAMARLKFLFGPTPANNKTLIERRREDDPLTAEDDLANSIGGSHGFGAILNGLASRPGGTPIPSSNVCTIGQIYSPGQCTCNGTSIMVGNTGQLQCS